MLYRLYKDFNHMWLTRCFAVFAVIYCLMVPGFAAEDNGSVYRLAPQDTIRIAVVEWKPDLGESRDWNSINGEYVLDGAGNLSIPYIGLVEANGKTTADIASLISNSLRKNLGLNGFPQASVSIAQYRPVFITGQVQRPDQYEYFPGMSVLKLVAVAGGISRQDPEGKDLTANIISTKSGYEELYDTRVALLTKASRLKAEIAREKDVSYSDEVTGHPNFKDIARGEEVIKEANDARMKRQLVALDELKGLLSSQLVTLDNQLKTLKTQEEFAVAERESVRELADKGLAVNSRVRAAHQFLSQTQTNILSTQTDILRVKQELNKAERDSASLLDDRDADLASELQEVERELRIVEIKMALSRDQLSLFLATNSANLLQEASEFKIVYSISRDKDGETQKMIATDDHPVLPGDVVQVIIEPIHSEVTSN